MTDEGSQAHGADRAFANIGVTVTVAAQFDLRVIEMEAPESMHANTHVDFLDEFVRGMRGRIVDTTRPKVLRINAHADPFVAASGVDQGLDLVETSTNRTVGTCRVLDQDRTVLDAR